MRIIGGKGGESLSDDYILALDQGTTSSRAVLFNRRGQAVAAAQKEFAQYYPRPGWVEHDPREIWSTQAGVAAEAITQAGVARAQIRAIGITNQRETTIVWDRESGLPIYNAIVWQDRRTADVCEALSAAGHAASIQQKTGLLVDAYFSATKIGWILKHVEGAREKARAGRLAFGTVDSWLIWNITGGRAHLTDVTNASRTMLFNIHTLEWDQHLLDLMEIPRAMLPRVCDSSGIHANTGPAVFPAGVAIAGIAGDQQAALFGQMCTRPGMVKATYGTGGFVVMNTGARPIVSKHKLLTTLAWKIGSEVHYALEGSIFIAGALVQWLRDALGLFPASSEIETLARSVPDSAGVYFVPAFAGLGAPHWNPRARGAMFGATRGTSAAHLARAALEAIAYQTLDVIRVMELDAELKVVQLRVDGGASANDLLMQMQSDLLQLNVVRPRIVETTAFGAACLAGLASGFWGDREDIERQWQLDRAFAPERAAADVVHAIAGWHRAVRAAVAWADDGA